MSISGAIKNGAFRGAMLAERALGRDSTPVRLGEIKNFLLLQHATALGSVIHATPLVAALKQTVPGCRIVVAASGMAVEIFRENPGVEAVVETPSPLIDLWGAAAALRRAKPFQGEPFATITSVANERTRVTLSAMIAGAGNRVGFALAPELHRLPLKLDRGISLIANNLRIVEVLGHAPMPRSFEPEVFFGENDKEFVRRELMQAGIEEQTPLAVLVTQTSATQPKSWRAERFRQTAEFLYQRYGTHVLFVGTADEAAAIEEIRGGLEFPTTSMAGKTSLTQLAALLSACRIGVTLDTGTMHLGRAVGLRMVIIAPAWSPPVEWLPVGDDRFQILKKLETEVGAPGYVIDEVSVDDVREAVSDLLERYRPSGSRWFPRSFA